MLHYKTIEPNTLVLLKRLCAEAALKDYILVGGTALALQAGHRKSVDLDFFCYGEYDAQEIAKKIGELYGYREVSFSETMSIGYINDVKIDFVKARNRLVNRVVNIDGIRLADKKDIAAMKLWAIARSGTRLKDYVDIACLSTSMSLEEMLIAYCKAYNTDSAMYATKRLLCFTGIENFESVEMVDGKMDWLVIKKRLQDMVKQPERIFEKLPLLEERNLAEKSPLRRFFDELKIRLQVKKDNAKSASLSLEQENIFLNAEDVKQISDPPQINDPEDTKELVLESLTTFDIGENINELSKENLKELDTVGQIDGPVQIYFGRMPVEVLVAKDEDRIVCMNASDVRQILGASRGNAPKEIKTIDNETIGTLSRGFSIQKDGRFFHFDILKKQIVEWEPYRAMLRRKSEEAERKNVEQALSRSEQNDAPSVKHHR